MLVPVHVRNVPIRNPCRTPYMGPTASRAYSSPSPPTEAAAGASSAGGSALAAPDATLPAATASARSLTTEFDDQFDRADAVIVAWNGQVDVVRVAIRVDHGYGSDPQFLRFADSILFLPGIDHDQALRQPVHGADAVEVAIHLAIFAIQGRLHLLRVGGDLLALAERFQLLEPGKPAANRAEIGQRTPQPAIADVRHAATLGLLLDRLGRLAFGAHEQHQAPPGSHPLQVFPRAQQPADRLANVDDVD